jgi:acetyl-CoA carboxylase biotin carboxylase subunit
VDTHIFENYLFPPYYDSLMAKLIVRSHDRDSAVVAMRAAIEDTRIEGVDTVLDVHRAVLDSAEFRRGGVTTEWLDHFWPRPIDAPERPASSARDLVANGVVS